MPILALIVLTLAVGSTVDAPQTEAGASCAHTLTTVVDGGGGALVGVTPEGVTMVVGLDAPVLVNAPGADVVDIGLGDAEAGEDLVELVKGAGGDARHM